VPQTFNNPFSPILRGCSLALAAVMILSILFLGRDPHTVHLVGLKPPFDKLEHMAAFGMIAALIRMGTMRLSFVGIGVGVILIGALDEYLQLSLSFRSADFFDLVADSIGVILTLLFFKRLSSI
jgi:VanZ family protein